MHVRHVSLIDYRSYESVELGLGPGVTTFVGANGQGKTNLVEAIGFAATGRSHRVAVDAPLVRMGAQRAIVRVQAQRGGRDLLVEIEINPGRSNRARLNRAPVPRQRDALGQLRRVLFCPEDLSLVKGDPGERRAFLDDLIVAMAPRFDGVLADLDRVLRQRNSLLKSASGLRSGGARSRAAAEQTLSVWDDQLVALAGEVIEARARLVDQLSDPVRHRYSAVAPEDRDPQVGIRYQPGVPEIGDFGRSSIEQATRTALAARRDEEFARGLTLVGPHRDEVVLTLHDLPVRGYASHGESWSMSLALRLASFDLLAVDSGPEGDPVLILDDVFAELDSGRRERLAAAVMGVEQVLITAAVADDVPASLRGRVLTVAGGLVEGGT